MELFLAILKFTGKAIVFLWILVVLYFIAVGFIGNINRHIRRAEERHREQLNSVDMYRE